MSCIAREEQGAKSVLEAAAKVIALSAQMFSSDFGDEAAAADERRSGS